MSEQDTIFVGNGKARQFPGGGTIINISLCKEDLLAAKEHFNKAKNGKTYISLDLCENRNGENDWGQTHYVKVNTWKPDADKQQKKPQAARAQPPKQDDFDDDVPF